MTAQLTHSHRFDGTPAAAPGADSTGFGTWAGIALALSGLARQVRKRVAEEIRYRRALQELHQLDDRDLDDIDVARVDFPELAWRHATGAAPLARRRA
jgi:uncharacterized protein YjiS (DUF1127 family)